MFHSARLEVEAISHHGVLFPNFVADLIRYGNTKPHNKLTTSSGGVGIPVPQHFAYNPSLLQTYFSCWTIDMSIEALYKC